jgi:hypothetical protein
MRWSDEPLGGGGKTVNPMGLGFWHQWILRWSLIPTLPSTADWPLVIFSLAQYQLDFLLGLNHTPQVLFSHQLFLSIVPLFPGSAHFVELCHYLKEKRYVSVLWIIQYEFISNMSCGFCITMSQLESSWGTLSDGTISFSLQPFSGTHAFSEFFSKNFGQQQSQINHSYSTWPLLGHMFIICWFTGQATRK